MLVTPSSSPMDPSLLPSSSCARLGIMPAIEANSTLLSMLRQLMLMLSAMSAQTREDVQGTQHEVRSPDVGHESLSIMATKYTTQVNAVRAHVELIFAVAQGEEETKKIILEEACKCKEESLRTKQQNTDLQRRIEAATDELQVLRNITKQLLEGSSKTAQASATPPREDKRQSPLKSTGETNSSSERLVSIEKSANEEPDSKRMKVEPKVETSVAKVEPTTQQSKPATKQVIEDSWASEVLLGLSLGDSTESAPTSPVALPITAPVSPPVAVITPVKIVTKEEEVSTPDRRNSSDDSGSSINASNSGLSSSSRKKRRGKLPETATQILKRWLLDHQPHPYPTEDEKAALALQTVLTLNQINNWFTNARRRILPKQQVQTTPKPNSPPLTPITATSLPPNHNTSPPCKPPQQPTIITPILTLPLSQSHSQPSVIPSLTSTLTAQLKSTSNQLGLAFMEQLRQGCVTQKPQSVSTPLPATQTPLL